MWSKDESVAAYAARKGLAPTRTLELGEGETLELVLVPAGRFTMGAPPLEGIRGAEETQNTVTLTRPCYMGRYEVTQSQFQAVMGRNPSRFKGPKRPADRVSWTDAGTFCEKVSARTGETVRLPTEAEWEFACRAGTTTAFAFGDTLTTEEANFDGEHSVDPGHGAARGETVDVGTFAPNAFGLYDMHGNLTEWCGDFFGPYPEGPATDPKGPDSGMDYVKRGGSYKDAARNCRSAYRSSDSVLDVTDRHGFRVVVEAGKGA